MQITVSSNNQIVRFMLRMRKLRDIQWRDFPDDICTLTREFLSSAGLFSLLTSLAGIVLACMIFWPICFIYGFPAEPKGGAPVALFIGGLGWLGTFIALGLLAYEWAEARGYTERLAPVTSAIGNATEKARRSLVAEMFRSLKDKTCIRVRVN